jgi:hypothetical protein
MTSDALKEFFDLTNPPFARMPAEQVFATVDALIPGYRDAPTKITTAVALARPCRTMRHRVCRNMARFTYSRLTVAQQCDCQVAMWALTGGPACVKVVVDYADGIVPCPTPYRVSAAWAATSIGTLNAKWAAAVQHVRDCRKNQN